MPPCILIVSFYSAPPTGVIYVPLFPPWAPYFAGKKKWKMQKAEQSLVTQTVAWFESLLCYNQNAIDSTHLSHGDPIYWLARPGGGKGVITSKYHTGTAAGLLIGSVQVTQFQLDWRSDFDSVCCQECFVFSFLKKWPYFSPSGWSNEWSLRWQPLLRNVGAYWGLQWMVLLFHWKKIKCTGLLKNELEPWMFCTNARSFCHQSACQSFHDCSCRLRFSTSLPSLELHPWWCHKVHACRDRSAHTEGAEETLLR